MPLDDIKSSRFLTIHYLPRVQLLHPVRTSRQRLRRGRNYVCPIAHGHIYTIASRFLGRRPVTKSTEKNLRLVV